MLHIRLVMETDFFFFFLSPGWKVSENSGYSPSCNIWCGASLQEAEFYGAAVWTGNIPTRRAEDSSYSETHTTQPR